MNAAARAALRRLLRRFRRGEDEGADVARVQGVLGDVSAISSASTSNAGSCLDRRDWALMPLMGSLAIGILIVPIGTMLRAAPLNGLIWRRRLLADATAVQLTRDPQALAEA